MSTVTLCGSSTAQHGTAYKTITFETDIVILFAGAVEGNEFV